MVPVKGKSPKFGEQVKRKLVLILAVRIFS